MAEDSGMQSPSEREAIGGEAIVVRIHMHRCARVSGPSSRPVHALLCNYPHTQLRTTAQLSCFRWQRDCETFSIK